MRFPVVLLDLDGTVIDSGAIILASMRHAAKEVLGAEIPDEETQLQAGDQVLAILEPGKEDELRRILLSS